mmetsp:Transcript_792/g.1880  ORF Transcript_792/g.1880 Transcript_792/m.1880 type:complete len:85 (+) Transcript_792:1354-1608(+)
MRHTPREIHNRHAVAVGVLLCGYVCASVYIECKGERRTVRNLDLGDEIGYWSWFDPTEMQGCQCTLQRTKRLIPAAAQNMILED